jgi:Zn-dependent protease
MDSSVLMDVLVWLVPLVIAIVGHEMGHAYVARRLGDPTATEQGRLSWNPLVHVDPVGSVLVPVFMWLFTPVIFGWAKPVPVDPRRLGSPRRDMAVVAAAGPAANLVMALMWGIALRIAMEFQLGVGLIQMCWVAISINIALALVNLLPVLPLDGGRIVACLLPPRFGPWMQAATKPMILVLLALLFFGGLDAIISPWIITFTDLVVRLATSV